MVFTPPSWVPQLPFDPPDSIPIHEFWSNERYGRLPLARSRDPFVCGVTGKSYTNAQMTERFHLLATSLAKRMGWRPNDETPWDKVVAVFAFNSIDYIMSTYAIHRVGGIATPANAMYSGAELEYQFKSSGAKAIFTCAPLLETALKAAKNCGIPEDNVFLMDVAVPGPTPPSNFKTLNQLIDEAKSLPELEPLVFNKGQGARQTAYLCYSSGTSGLPKAVKIAHINVIANLMQMRWYDHPGRVAMGMETQVIADVLPLSHIYGLVIVAQVNIFRGDSVVVFPRMDFEKLLEGIQRFKINYLALVPPIIIAFIRNQEKCKKYDLSSVRLVYTGAAPLGAETQEELSKIFPTWIVAQGYGMTETSTVVLSTSVLDVVDGTCGSLVPGAKAKLLDENDREVTAHGERGELLVQTPSLTLGYLNNERATSEAYVHHEDGRWLRTGDIAICTVEKSGYEHFSVVDRKKELIKVKGFQVPPAELEAHILSHPAVADCAVIPVPDGSAGEIPKAYVVRSPEASSRPEDDVAREIVKYVEEHKVRYKWIKGGVEFIDTIPKNPTGKILRRVLRDKEAARRKAEGPKL